MRIKTCTATTLRSIKQPMDRLKKMFAIQAALDEMMQDQMLLVQHTLGMPSAFIHNGERPAWAAEYEKAGELLEMRINMKWMKRFLKEKHKNKHDQVVRPLPR